MPTRSRQHEIEDQSRIAFRSLVQPWVFRDKNPDYGIDGEVELFDKNGTATGELFLVQLKATNRMIGKRHRVSLKLEWIRYYLALELPVFVALWEEASKKLYWVWAGEIDLFYARPHAQSFVVELPNEWDFKTPDKIREELALHRRLRFGQVSLPLRITIEGSGAQEVGRKLERLLAYAPGSLSYCDEEPHLRCTLTRDELRVSLIGQRGTVFHTIREKDLDGKAKRIVIGTALTLSRLGAIEQAAELWSLVPGLVDGIGSKDVAWYVLSMLVRAGAHAELIALVRSLSARFDKIILIAPLIKMYWRSSHHRRQGLREVLVELFQDDLQNSSPVIRSVALYNLAKFSEKPTEQLRYFSRAMRESKTYWRKSYFWAELGALFFSNHRYDAALRCYEHAFRRLRDQNHVSYYGDALMHTGQYAAALKIFRGVVSNRKRKTPITTDVADAFLKGTAIEFIIKRFKVRKQNRCSRRADVLFAEFDWNHASNEQVVAKAEAVINQDVLHSPVWFNLGVRLNYDGQTDEAFYCFLVSAITSTGNDASWLNALALSAEQGADVKSCLITYLIENRAQGLGSFLKQMAADENDEERRSAMNAIARAFSENPPADQGVLRVHRRKGTPLVLPVPLREAEANPEAEPGRLIRRRRRKAMAKR